ncbi:hypothetical protein F4808DRAFT_437710 [Astrocystis sublimbata]|nr:hypothetical protein F4808DRAFT_437710 [Astrocystis sublimbata]
MPSDGSSATICHHDPDQSSIQEPIITPLPHIETQVQNSTAPQVHPPDEAQAIQSSEIQSRPSTSLEARPVHADNEPHTDLQSIHSISTLQPSQSLAAVQPTRKLTVKESIGIYGLLVLILGTLVTLASLGFIIFLWTGQGSSPGAIDAPPSWRTIILAGWITQATTLATLLIRIATASQATICTALLSALLVERRCVPKSEAPQFSILRAVNDGPFRLAQLIFNPRKFSRMASVEAILVISLLISTTFLQFSSTILFSDLHESAIAADTAPYHINNYIAGNVDGLYLIDVSQLPPPNTVFGEVPSNGSSNPDSLGFSNTGPKKRAFLPLREPGMRTSIHSYKGNAVTMSSDVACMRPEMQSSYFGVQKTSSGNTNEKFDFGQINGTLHYGKSLRNAHSVASLCDSQDCLSSVFNCSIPGGYEKQPTWTSSLCIVGAVNGYQPGGNSLGGDSSSKPWSNHSLIYLLFSTNMYTNDWNASHSGGELETSPTNHLGEWASYEIKQDRFINVTLCFSTFQTELSSVDMFASGSLIEPLGNWSATGVGDSTKVRKYLGVKDKNSTLADRGLLTIENIHPPQKLSPLEPIDPSDDPSSSPARTLAERAASDFGGGVYSHLTHSGSANSTATFQACTVCDFIGTVQHPELASIIQDTINETRRAADAIQAYTTSVANTFYNEFLKSFTGAEQAQIGFTKTVQTATNNGYRGLIAVSVFVLFHLLCVALTTGLYVNLTRYSRQGNTWHTVSQLMGSELATMLEQGYDIDDSTVSKEARTTGDEANVRLMKNDEGKISFVKVSEGVKAVQMKK